MKVDFSAGINLYRNSAAAAKARAEGEPVGGKTDVDAIERGSTQPLDKSATGFKAVLIGEIAASASPERIAQLTEQVRNGTYHVDSDKIAAAMLDVDV